MLWSAPIAFWFALSLAVIMILHGIKLFRRRIPTSTLFIWREIAKESQTSLRLERVVRNLPLLLQLLLAALLVLALAQPLFFSEVAFDKDVVLVVDASASMNTRTGDGTRFDEAREKALELVGNLGEGQKMALVAMERAPILIVPFTEDRGRLERGLEELQPSHAAADLKRTLFFALSLAKDLTRRQVILIGDGAYPDEGGAAGIFNDTVTFLPVGDGGDNVAIVRFAYRPYLPPLEGGEALLTLRNYSGERREVPLALAVGGKPLYRESVALDPGAESTLVVPVPAGMVGVARARLERGDDFPVDDTAYGIIENLRPVRVLMVGDASPPIRAVLTANRAVEVTFRRSPAGVAEVAGDYDLLLFHRAVPPPVERGTLLVIGALSPQGGLSAGEWVENPRVTGWRADHPLLQYLDPSRLPVVRARALTMEPGTQSLVDGEHGPLIALRDRGAVRVVTLGFDLEDTRIASDEVFPLFMANLIDWVRPAGGGDARRSLIAGESYTWRPAAVDSPRVVTGPDGQTWEYPPGADPIRFDHTRQVGIYTLRSNGTSEQIAVNLLDGGESDIARNANYVGRAADDGSERGVGEITFDGWPWLVSIGVLFLLVEWLIWSRYS